MRGFTVVFIVTAFVVFSCQSEEPQEQVPAPAAQTPPPLQAIAPTLPVEPQQVEQAVADTTPPPPPPTPLFPIDEETKKQPASHGGGGKPSVKPPINPNEIDTDTLPDSIKDKIPPKPSIPAGRLPKRPTKPGATKPGLKLKKTDQ